MLARVTGHLKAATSESCAGVRRHLVMAHHHGILWYRHDETSGQHCCAGIIADGEYSGEFFAGENSHDDKKQECRHSGRPARAHVLLLDAWRWRQ